MFRTRVPWITATAFCLLPLAHADELFVCGWLSKSVVRFDASTGALVDTPIPSQSGGLGLCHDIACGPDGALYVASYDTDEVLRFDADGQPLGVFVTSGDGGLNGPADLDFGPDGNLWVASLIQGAVLRFDGQTGAFLGAVVPAGANGLSGVEAIRFGPDGNLYVVSGAQNRVYRYDGQTGAFIDIFVAPGNLLNDPHYCIFGPDGNLYVSSFGSSRVNRYDGQTGAFIDTFVPPGDGLQQPHGIAFGPDGDFYVASFGNDRVLRYDGDGNFKQSFTTAGAGGLNGPTNLMFVPIEKPYYFAPVPGVVGQPSSFTVAKAKPNEPIFFLVGTQSGSIPVGTCAGVSVHIGDPILPLVTPADANGDLAFNVNVPSSVSGLTFYLQVLEVANCRASQVVKHTF